MDNQKLSKDELINALSKKQLEIDELNATLEGVETEKSKVDFLLCERIKELTCHNNISAVFATLKLSLEDLCERIILIVPEAFQFPDVAEVELVIYDQVFKSPGFRNCKKYIYQKIEVNAEEIGHLIVGYPENQLPETENLFLTEENNLLFYISVRLSRYLEKNLYEQALKESEDKYRSLIENINDVIYRVDTNQIITYISPSVQKILGYLPEEVIGRPFRAFFIESKDALNQRFELLKNKDDIHNEYKIKNKAGEDHWGRLSTRSIIKDGVFLGGAGTLVDITENKLIAMALHQSEEIYRNLVERSNDVIYEVNLKGKINFISPVIEKLLGFKPEYLIGRNFIDYVYEPDRRILAQELLREDSLVNPYVEYRYVNRTGILRWVRSSTFTLYENDVPVGKTGTIIDITEKKRAEEKLEQQNELMKAILKAMPDLVFIMDNNGTYLEYYADNVEELLAPKNELIGMNLRDLFDNETAKRHIKKIRECIQKKDVINYDYTITFNGVLIFYEVRLILLSDNKVLRFVRDITKRKSAENEILNLNVNLENKIKERTAQLAKTNLELLKEIEGRNRVEDDLKKARQDAEEANLAKSEFLSRMSHELRTPMNSILGFAQLLEMNELLPKQKKSVKHILHSGKILLDLINEVLDISRIESGRLSLSIEPVPLESVIKEIVDVVYLLAKAKQIKIELTDSPLSKLYIKSDRQRLKQILINLINNAIKYNKIGGLVSIKTELVPGLYENSQRIRISIIDKGIGISPEDLKKIFTPFERIGAEKSQTEGTGLGLTVVKKLVEAMGGKIGVESVKDVGSTFWFELPQAEHNQEELNPEVFLSLKSDNESFKGQILYVEDNQPNIELIEQIFSLQRSGIRLVVCKKGRDVVKVAKEKKPDLILLDLNLPDIHGSEVLEQLKADKITKDIPVVVISADAMPQQLEKLIKAGAKNYLTKPLDIKEFLEVIDTYFID